MTWLGALRSLSIGAALVATACTTFYARPAPHKPVHFESAPPPARGEKFPNWTLPPATTWAELDAVTSLPAVQREREGAGAGTTGAMKDTVFFPSLGKEVRFKIKKIPGDLDGINNAPRKEIAAYVIQFLFLDPEDFVVPTTFTHCTPLDEWNEQAKKPERESNLEGADCIFLVAALWLKDVKIPEVLYDEARFLEDPTYAYYLSNFNLLTYLIKHQDGRKGNFVVSKDDERRQVFSIDNGSTFDQPWHNFFVPNWNLLRVASVRKASIDRLRKLQRKDLDSLLVAAQVEVAEDGSATQVPSGPSIDDSKGAVRKGNVIQFGLTSEEIDAVWERLQALIAKVDDGELPVF